MYHGDIRLGDTVDFKFTTRRFTTGAPFTLAGSPVISAYVGNSTTEITAGITLTVDFDSRTGLNNVRVVATSGNGYATASNVDLVITTGTVDSVSVVGEVVASFSIEARSALMPTTAGRALDVTSGGEAGIDWGNIGNPATQNNMRNTVMRSTPNGIRLPYTEGNSDIFPNVDSSNSGFNISGPKITIPPNYTAVSVAIYVDTAAGNLRLGLYDATGAGGLPGALKAESASTAAVVGWNILTLVTPVALAAGSYYPAWQASSNSCVFRKGGGPGPSYEYAMAYGPFDSTFSASPTPEVNEWSIYVTFKPAIETAVDDLPTNAELAAALAAADDAMLAQIALVKAKTDNLPTDPADASDIAASFASLTTLVNDVPTNAELATALAAADDATLAAIAALSTSIGDIPTNAEIATALDAIPTAGENADAVWDEALAGHLTPGSTGEALDTAGSGGSAPTTAQIADKILGRSLAGGADGGRTVQDALRSLRNKSSITAGTLTVCMEDDTATAWTAVVTTAPGDPLTSIDPA